MNMQSDSHLYAIPVMLRLPHRIVEVFPHKFFLSRFLFLERKDDLLNFVIVEVAIESDHHCSDL
jgi:hypothetical protein